MFKEKTFFFYYNFSEEKQKWFFLLILQFFPFDEKSLLRQNWIMN